MRPRPPRALPAPPRSLSSQPSSLPSRRDDDDKKLRRQRRPAVVWLLLCLCLLLLSALLSLLLMPGGRPLPVLSPEPELRPVAARAQAAEAVEAVEAAEAAEAVGPAGDAVPHPLQSPPPSLSDTAAASRSRPELSGTAAAAGSPAPPTRPLPHGVRLLPGSASAARRRLSASELRLPSLLLPYARLRSAAASGPSPPARFHTAFFNEPYVRGRATPEREPSLVASNRALPHLFPSPLGAAADALSAGLVVGVLCYDVRRIELILDTWGRFVAPERLMLFSEPQQDAEADRAQAALPSVFVLSNAANGAREATDRRASAWKILPALRLMLQLHPQAAFFYLCDDDSFPVVPNLSLLAWSLYSPQLGLLPSQPLYVGESVQQSGLHKGYYADEPGRNVSLRYHCTGGGVLLNARLLQLLEPELDSCFVFFASDLSLGHCIQQQLQPASVRMLDVPSAAHLYSRTVEEVQARYSGKEQAVWQAAAFHHMREPFISQWGVDERLEMYLRESEQRTYAGYLFSMQLLETERTRESAAPDGRPLRLLLVAQCDGGGCLQLEQPMSSLLQLLLRHEGWQPLAFLTQLLLDSDLLLVPAVDSRHCGLCDWYGASRSACTQALSSQPAALFRHVQQQQQTRGRRGGGGAVLRAELVTVGQLAYGEYELVLSMDALLDAPQPGRALFAHFSQSSCSFPYSTPPAPYSLALVDELSLLDAEAAASAPPAASFLLAFPSVSVFYGAYHALGLTPQPTPHSERAAVAVVVGPSGEALSQRVAAACRLQRLRPDSLPVSDVDASVIARLSVARLCLFPALLKGAADEELASWSRAERRRLVRLVLTAIAAGCLCIVSEVAARWSLRGEETRSPADGPLSLLLSRETTAGSADELLAALSRAATLRLYGVELGYQRAALNAQLLEKPWHQLLQRMRHTYD